MIAQQFGSVSKGAARSHEIGELGRQGLGMAWRWACLAWRLCGCDCAFSLVFALSDYTLQITEQYLRFVGLAMPAAMIHRSLHAYASSLNKPNVIMWVSWLCFFLNIPLNWISSMANLACLRWAVLAADWRQPSSFG
ncbi:multidrug efflux protein [Moraxella caviae]|nr:multidrug efflux protein [Moraxella caviae]